MKALSLFSGAGGLDLGCEAAGFRTVAAVEWDRTAQATLLRNSEEFLPDLHHAAVLGDITALEVNELLEAAGLRVGEAALLHGGPPCTPFSKSGYWLEYKRLGADPRASLLDHYVRVLSEARPMAYLMENVYGLAYRNQNAPVFERFRHGVRQAGYSLSWRIVLAADYGVPQLRQRLVCVGIRSDLLEQPVDEWTFEWPKATHSGPHETRKGWDESLEPHISSRTALEDLHTEMNPPETEEIVEGTYAEELRPIPPGENYLFWTAERGHPAPRFKWRSRYWSFLLKLDPNRPSPTIQGQPGPWVGPFHWESRRLRVAELKRLMTFPDEFVVLGTRREQQLQLGNAVPPLLAQVVAESIAAELERLGVVSRDDSVAIAA